MVSPQTEPAEPDLTHHGDRDLVAGLVDFAVNVRDVRPPQWLVEVLSRPERWAAYPDPSQARAAIARRHGVDETLVLPCAGAAEAFTLVARGLGVRRACVVHPQFTEPEQALRVAGVPVERVVLSEPFELDPASVPDDADLVVVGNPTNPTGVLHPAEVLQELVRPERVLLVDEAFLDAVPGEPETMIKSDMAGVLVTRSLTKTFSLAGLRAGYVVGDPALVARLAAVQTPWSVSAPAADAMVACSSPQAVAWAHEVAEQVVRDREQMITLLSGAGVRVCADSSAPFVLIDTSAIGLGSQREPLSKLGFSVRRGESFPGLGEHHLRLAVRDPRVARELSRALATLAPSGRTIA